MIGVRTTSERFRAAVAELPLSLHMDASGEVTVIDGAAGWPRRVLEAADHADALVVSEPVPVDAAELDGIRPSVPVIVERSRLRPLPTSAGSVVQQGRAVVVQAAIPIVDDGAWLRDAIGWARVAAGGELDVRAVEDTDHSVLALLAGVRAVPASLILSRTAGPPIIEVRVLGEERLTVRVERSSARVSVSDTRGELTFPAEHESSARAALRRALAAVSGAEVPTDLDELRHDEESRARLQRSVAGSASNSAAASRKSPRIH